MRLNVYSYDVFSNNYLYELYYRYECKLSNARAVI